MPYFPTNSINIYRWTDCPTLGTEYDKPIKGLVFQSKNTGDFQPMTPGEASIDFGIVGQDMAELYLEMDVDIRIDDIVMVDDLPVQWKVHGNPQIYNTLLMYQLAALKREAVINPTYTTTDG